jgi:pimeloyl-ACP methyl ester carboxylesterase
MKGSTFLWIVMLALSGVSFAQTNVYLIPGQGADQRLFNNFQLDSSFFVHHIQYFTPKKGTDMVTFAKQLATQIDTTKPFILIGTSLGGMLAIEMNEFLNPEKTIIISSAKCRKELPRRYRFMKAVPIYKIVPPRVVRGGAKMLQPIVEPDRRREKQVFKSMLRDKDPLFMKRSVAMIINWERTTTNESIYHIHGANDHTLPVDNIEDATVIANGSHMMTLTEGAELSQIINAIIQN